MTTETKQLLARWQGLKDGDGIRRATSATVLLWVIEFALFLFLVLGFVYRFHPAAIAVGALIMGWVVAERNALRTRLAQWPIVERYIDWQRVQADLASETEKV